jgi:hypothetical protein
MDAAPIPLALTFLGSRRYLQGTTLFDALLPYVPPDARIVFRIPRPIYSDRVEVLARPSPPPATAEEFAATLTWENAAARGELVVRALPPSQPRRETPYDESRLTALAEFRDGEARLACPSPFTFCATVVSLNKAMLHRDLPPPGPGRWLFVRLDLAHNPGEALPLAVRRQKVVPGGRLVKSEILAGGATAGDLYFAWHEGN